jgi:hypothetical protein
MQPRFALAALAALLAAPLAAQRDFLTADEVDQIRLAQDPNTRLKLYTSFAELRIELLTQLFAAEKPGRSALIHDTLDDYTKIIEAIDIVADDGLKRNLSIDEGIGAVAASQEKMLAALKKFEDSEPKDLARYKYSLTNAIEATEDSLELAREDLAERKADVAKRAGEERKQREELMTPTDLESRKAAEKKKAAEETKEKRKAPSLRKPGETATPKQ